MRASIRHSRGVHKRGHSICLGVVVKPHFGRDDEVMRALEAEPRIQVGPIEAGGIPGCVVTAIGADRELLAELGAIPSVLAVEVVYAQELPPDSETTDSETTKSEDVR